MNIWLYSAFSHKNDATHIPMINKKNNDDDVMLNILTYLIFVLEYVAVDITKRTMR